MTAPEFDIDAADFVLGLTDAAERETARARLSSDPAFAEAVTDWERRFAPLATSVEQIAPPARLFRAIVDRIDGLAGSKVTAGPAAARTLRAGERTWRMLGPGISTCLLSRTGSPPRQTILLRCEPGAIFPQHGHGGDEEILVLEGDFVMGDLELTAGDYHFAAKGHTHPTATTRNGCLLLVTAAL